MDAIQDMLRICLRGLKYFQGKIYHRSTVILRVTIPNQNDVEVKTIQPHTGYATHLPSGDKIYSRKIKSSAQYRVFESVI